VKRGFERFTRAYCSNLCSNCTSDVLRGRYSSIDRHPSTYSNETLDVLGFEDANESETSQVLGIR